VWGVERVRELVVFGQENLGTYNFPHAHITRAHKELGLAEHAPYDTILVSAGSNRVPQQLIDQLTVGGTMVVPVEDAILRVTKTSAKETKEERYEGFVFVPLVHHD
jgi:protein-L-isoaspartate(D-aspartate) O-methyltransferase